MDDPNDHSNRVPDTVATVPERSRFLSALGFSRWGADAGNLPTTPEPEEGSASVSVGSVRPWETEPAKGTEGSVSGVVGSPESALVPANEPVVAVIGDAGVWSEWRQDDPVVTSEVNKPREGGLTDARVEVKPFTPLDEPEPFGMEGGDGISADDRDDEESVGEDEVVLLANLGPDFLASEDGIESMENELLGGFDDESPPFFREKGVESVKTPEVDSEGGRRLPAKGTVASVPAIPWLSPRKNRDAVASPFEEMKSSEAFPFSGEALSHPAIHEQAVVEAETGSERSEATGKAEVSPPVPEFSLDDFRSRLSRDLETTAKTPTSPISIDPTTGGDIPGWSQPTAWGPDAVDPTTPETLDDLDPKGETLPWGQFSWVPKGVVQPDGGGRASLANDDVPLVSDGGEDARSLNFGEKLPSSRQTMETSAEGGGAAEDTREEVSPPIPPSPMWTPPAKVEVFSASPEGGIVDVSCPSCSRGLSLKHEHLGIAGHCVWCQTPVVAAVSGVTGEVSVFAIGVSASAETGGGICGAGASSATADWPWGIEEDRKMESPADPVGRDSGPEVPAIAVVSPESNPFELQPKGTDESVFSAPLETPEKSFPVSPFRMEPLEGKSMSSSFLIAAGDGEGVQGLSGLESTGVSAFEAAGSFEPLSDFLAPAVVSEGAKPLSAASPGMWAVPAPFGNGLGESKADAPLDEVGAVEIAGGGSEATELASLTGVERAAALSRSLWPSVSGAPKGTPDFSARLAEKAPAKPMGNAAFSNSATAVDDPKASVKLEGGSQPTPARVGKQRRLGKNLFWSILMVGLVAGMAAAAFFWKDLEMLIKPRMERLIEKAAPSAEAAGPARSAQLAGENESAPASTADRPPSAGVEVKSPKSAFEKRPLRIQDSPVSTSEISE